VIEAFFGGPVAVRRRAGLPGVPPGGQLACLAMQPGEALLHRGVALLARGVPVSEADLWYVPDRLPSAMAEALAETDRPFGTVVAPLRPNRETLRLRMCEDREPIWLEIEALLRDGGGAPIALVHERYLRGACALLDSSHCNTSLFSRTRQGPT
jgi:hypothetical protein